MNPQTHIIFLIIIVGIGSFLIGWFLTYSRWKKKYWEIKRDNENLDSTVVELKREIHQQYLKEKEYKFQLANHEDAVNELEKGKVELLEINKKLRKELEKRETTQKQKVKIEAKVIEKKEPLRPKEKTKPTDSKTNLVVPLSQLISSSQDSKETIQQHKISENNTTTYSSNKDDLTLIEGITSDFQKDLNNLGYFTYKQIALMTSKDFELIEQSFNGKKVDSKNDWREQAKQLYQSKLEKKLEE